MGWIYRRSDQVTAKSGGGGGNIQSLMTEYTERTFLPGRSFLKFSVAILITDQDGLLLVQLVKPRRRCGPARFLSRILFLRGLMSSQEKDKRVV